MQIVIKYLRPTWWGIVPINQLVFLVQAWSLLLYYVHAQYTFLWNGFVHY